MNCPEIKRGFSQANIYLGMLFILIGIYEFLSAEILSGRKFSLIIIGFGILTILWGYLDAKRLKRKR